MKDSKKTTTLYLTIGLGAAALAYAFLIFVPGQVAISGMRKTVIQRQSTILDSEQVKAGIQQSETGLKQIEAFRMKWKGHAPTEERVTTAFAAVSRDAKEAGASIVRFEPQPVARLAGISQVPVSVTAEGKFEELFEFLRRIDDSFSPIWAREMILTSQRQNGPVLRCQMILTIFADNRANSG